MTPRPPTQLITQRPLSNSARNVRNKVYSCKRVNDPARKRAEVFWKLCKEAQEAALSRRAFQGRHLLRARMIRSRGFPRARVRLKGRSTQGADRMTDTILDRCEAKGLRLTEQRRTIAAVLEEAEDHPDVEELYARASTVDPRISLATVYRTVKLFEEAGILERLDFRDGRARYEDADRDHHDHLIDLHSGEVIEFVDAEIEELQEKIAQKLGYDLKGHRLELYAVPRKTK